MQAKATRCIIPVAPSRETELCAQDGPARVKIALADVRAPNFIADAPPEPHDPTLTATENQANRPSLGFHVKDFSLAPA
jgi:hypothetical protein